MPTFSTPSDRIAEAERRIAWVLAHPGISPWLKHALRAALACDPVVASNDVDLLRELVRTRTDRCHRLRAAEALRLSFYDGSR